MVAITASAETSPAGIPRMRLAITGGSGSTATVYRGDEVTSQNVAVRQGNPAALVSGAATIYDYEATFGNYVHYDVTDAGSFTARSASVYLWAGVPWLVHPGRPDLSVPLAVTQWPAWSRPIVRGVFQPIGRVRRVVVSGLRQSKEGDLAVYTSSETERAALEAILADGSPLLLKGSSEGAGTYWVSVGDVTGAPAGVDLRGYTTWTLPLVEVDAPPAKALPPVTYSQATVAFINYASSAAAAPAYADRIAGTWA